MRTLLALALLVSPLTTWYVAQAPTTLYDVGYYVTPLRWLSVLGLLAITALLMRWNAPVAAFAGYAALSTLWGPMYGLNVAAWVVLGAGLVAVCASAKPAVIRTALLGLGLLEVAIFSLQYLGVWIPLGEWMGQQVIPHGSFGNPRYLGEALAIIVAAVPIWAVVWAVPILLVGIVLSKSYIALAAAITALLVRHRRWALLTGAAVAMLIGVRLMGRDLNLVTGHGLDSLWTRLGAASIALHDISWSSLLVGHGFGAWFTRMAGLQVGRPEILLTAHNEYLQLLYEAGLIGCGFVVWFLVRHRLWFRREPALIAVAVLSIAFFPFHMPTVAALTLVVLGLAARNDLRLA